MYATFTNLGHLYHPQISTPLLEGYNTGNIKTLDLPKLMKNTFHPQPLPKSWDFISTLSFLHQQQNMNNLTTVIQHTGSWKEFNYTFAFFLLTAVKNE
jgi:hypothetical protein